MITKPSKLDNVIDNSGLEPSTGLMIKSSFTEFIEKASEWESLVKAINVTSEMQVEDMKKAGEYRKALKKIRVNADKKRAELKADSIKYGKAVQEAYNLIRDTIVPLEEYAEQQEKFIEIQEQIRQAKLKEERHEELSKNGLLSYYQASGYGSLEKLSDMQYMEMLNVLDSKKEAYEQQVAKEREERIKREIEEEERKLQLEEENKRLQEELKKKENEIKESKQQTLFEDIDEVKPAKPNELEAILVRLDAFMDPLDLTDDKAKQVWNKIMANAKSMKDYVSNLIN